jgi:hypothetical protein
MRLSTELRQAVILHPEKQYKFAQAIGAHPSVLSAWMNAIVPVREGDLRVLKLAELVGIPAERAFDPDPPYPQVEIRSARR